MHFLLGFVTTKRKLMGYRAYVKFRLIQSAFYLNLARRTREILDSKSELWCQVTVMCNIVGHHPERSSAIIVTMCKIHPLFVVLMLGCHYSRRKFRVFVCPPVSSVLAPTTRFSWAPCSAEVNAIGCAQLRDAPISSGAAHFVGQMMREVWKCVGRRSVGGLLMTRLNSLARHLSHLLASHCRRPLGEQFGLPFTRPAARLDAHEEFNMASWCRPNVPKSNSYVLE